jgi:hypothetical protein
VNNPRLYQAAQQWADLFNQLPPSSVPDVIAESGVEEYFDDRTNLFLLASEEPTDMALVLSAVPESDSDDYVLVRWDGEAWAVDSGPVDWEDLEEAAFGSDFDSD